ncbi:Hypothetical_protein [Hexamita inflata]|uniref:Hypothetical_protein n=1 Tax=Hexamita inflata TaxID=28002 RepID=A0AA86PZP7_9EUKA|nr:Hypothetical protein HINF_LOCUS36726 [Hexamita inflata]
MDAYPQFDLACMYWNIFCDYQKQIFKDIDNAVHSFKREGLSCAEAQNNCFLQLFINESLPSSKSSEQIFLNQLRQEYRNKYSSLLKTWKEKIDQFDKHMIEQQILVEKRKKDQISEETQNKIQRFFTYSVENIEEEEDQHSSNVFAKLLQQGQNSYNNIFDNLDNLFSLQSNQKQTNIQNIYEIFKKRNKSSILEQSKSNLSNSKQHNINNQDLKICDQQPSRQELLNTIIQDIIEDNQMQPNKLYLKMLNQNKQQQQKQNKQTVYNVQKDLQTIQQQREEAKIKLSMKNEIKTQYINKIQEQQENIKELIQTRYKIKEQLKLAKPGGKLHNQILKQLDDINKLMQIK